MIRHIIKLVWNRKRANALVALEITISFLVLFAVVSFGTFCWLNYRRPLGFSYQDVWNVSIAQNEAGEEEWTPARLQTMRQIFQEVRGMREVESVAGVFSPPYSSIHSIGVYDLKDRSIELHRNTVTDDYAKVMRLSLVKGRWFSREDDAAPYEPVVITQRMARELCGSDDPIGKSLTLEDDSKERIIGVIDEFRRDGEYFPPVNFAFFRASLEAQESGVSDILSVPNTLAVRVSPGTSRAFEERLAKALQAVAPAYSFEVKPLAEIRATMLRLQRVPIIVLSLVALFLLMMVGLGLTGVLWQNVTQRTKEIGLRRAKGATGMDIHLQILGEILVVTSLGMGLGLLIAVQFPLLALVGSVGPEVYAASFAVSILLIYALTTLCGLYPSWLASRVQPAEALHYE